MCVCTCGFYVCISACMCGCMFAYVHPCAVVCASGFARGLSVDSVAGAVYEISCMCVFLSVCVRMCIHVWLYVLRLRQRSVAAYVCLHVCVCVHVCLLVWASGFARGLSVESICVHICVVVCASGFARGLSVDSAVGAVYQINSLIYTGPGRQEFKQQSINQAVEVEIKDLKRH